MALKSLLKDNPNLEIVESTYGYTRQEVIFLMHSLFYDKLHSRNTTITLEHVLENAKADSGGERDLSFLNYLLENGLLGEEELLLKRTIIGMSETYYTDKYVKVSHESSRHFLCRASIQEELEKMDFETIADLGVGNMDILRSNSNYDIVTTDFSAIIDIGLTPARNFFRGLTDLKVKDYLITSYFDDYMDDIIFRCFYRIKDSEFIDAVKDYEEGFKLFIPNLKGMDSEEFYNNPHNV